MRQKESDRFRFCAGDLVCTAAVILLAGLLAALFCWQRAGAEEKHVEIYQNGKLLYICDPEREQTISVTGSFTNLVEIGNGKAAVIFSDCPGGDCVCRGWISEAGQSSVCLPNGTEVRIVGRQREVDLVVG